MNRFIVTVLLTLTCLCAYTEEKDAWDFDRNKKTKQQFTSGTYVARKDHSLAKLADYLLKSELNDGLLMWSFFDDPLAVGEKYPVMRIASPVELKTAPGQAIDPSEQIDLGMIQGPNQVLPESKPPRWLKENYLMIEDLGRKWIMDAETGAITSRKATHCLLDETTVSLLISAGFTEDVAESLAEATLTWSPYERYAVIQRGNNSALLDLQEKSASRLGTGQEVVELLTFSPDESALAFHDGGQLNVRQLPGGPTAVVASDLRADSVSHHLVGKLDWVYQEELYGRDNFKGYWWNPDSQGIAFLELDETGVRTFPIVDHLSVVNTANMMDYPKAGDPNPRVRVGVARLNGGASTARWVDLSLYESEPILISWVSWSPDGKQLFLQIQNRAQTWLDLLVTDAKGENPQVLFRDKTPAWIESPGNLHWLKDGSFLWLSPRSGYRHVYLYSAGGELIRQLTDGEWEIRDLLAFDAENERLYFSTACDQAYNLHVYELNLSTGGTRKLTDEDGTHLASFSDDSQFFIDTFSTVDRPEEYYLYRADGTKLRRLNTSSYDQFDFLDLGKHQFLTIDAESEQPMDALLITPPDFDSAKKYPVLIHIYAGPQAPRVRNQFQGAWGLWHQMLAQQGYVIWMCDNRSASYRSSKHVWPIHRNLAENELKDIQTGVDWLKQQPWVDPDRIGIWGWSYGGYMTAFAMTHSDQFKMGISGAPVTDWRNYNSIYTERLMGLPQDNQEGYEKTSVIQAAKNLHGKILLIHGSVDENVHMSNSLQLVKALQESGKQFELMIYPDTRHAVRDSKQLTHLHQLMMEFVKKNL